MKKLIAVQVSLISFLSFAGTAIADPIDPPMSFEAAQSEYLKAVRDTQAANDADQIKIDAEIAAREAEAKTIQSKLNACTTFECSEKLGKEYEHAKALASLGSCLWGSYSGTRLCVLRDGMIKRSENLTVNSNILVLRAFQTESMDILKSVKGLEYFKAGDWRDCPKTVKSDWDSKVVYLAEGSHCRQVTVEYKLQDSFYRVEFTAGIGNAKSGEIFLAAGSNRASLGDRLSDDAKHLSKGKMLNYGVGKTADEFVRHRSCPKDTDVYDCKVVEFYSKNGDIAYQTIVTGRAP